MCTWCGQYWECDGEGGEPCRDCVGERDSEGWKIDKREVVKNERGEVILGPGGKPIEARIQGSVSSMNGTRTIAVMLNGQDVKSRGGTGGPRPRHFEPPRNRRWAINEVVDLLEEGTNEKVKDAKGRPIRVRVQGYAYQYDANLHGKNHPPGWGPKICWSALH